MATPGPGGNQEQQRDVVLRARRQTEQAQHKAVAEAVRRRYLVQTASEPDATSRADVVMLRKDLLNVVVSPSMGAVEVEVVIDADGGVRFYVVP